MDVLGEQLKSHLDCLLSKDGTRGPCDPRLAGEEVDLGQTTNPVLVELKTVSHQAVRVATELDDLPGWLVDAASQLAELGLWSILDVDSTDSIRLDSPIGAFRLGLRGIRLRREGNLHESLKALSFALAGQLFLAQQVTSWPCIERTQSGRWAATKRRS
jgi:hypothetical protein